MELKITKERRLKEIQAEFNSFFEYLKIEFCLKPHKDKEGTSKKFIITTDKLLSEISNRFTEKTITIANNMLVSELESVFQAEIGLPIQVFRKSGPSWLETTSTDDWSLEKQNQYGSMLATKITREKISEFDNNATK
jgi:hypothetical protein